MFGLGVLLAPLPALLLNPVGVEGVVMAALLTAIDAAISFAATGFGAILRGRNRFGAQAQAQVAQAAVGVAVAVVAIPSSGLVGAALAAVASRLALLTATLVAGVLRDGSYGRPDRLATKSVLKFAAPLWLVALAGQISLSTDIPIVGGFFGASAAGHYGAGTTITAAAAGLLFAVIDVTYYRFTAAADGTGRLLRWVVTSSGLLAGLGFTLIVVLRDPILRLWLGETNALASSVIVAYSLVWMINAPSHALVLQAMAQGTHTRLGYVVLVEAGASVVLSVALALVIGPLGPAIATVVTVGISNGVIVPLLLSRQSDFDVLDFYLRCGVSITAGALTAILIVLPVLLLGTSDVIAVSWSAVCGGVLGVAILRRQGSARHELLRARGLLLHGGWRLLLAERRERSEMRATLARHRLAPVVWTQSEPPLVTVRIATYNRGRLVAERAIASALSQTHPNVEVVVVGDHCDEATAAAVLSVRDRRVRFENLPERGRYPKEPTRRWMVAGTVPMNRGVDLARGTWLAPLDDDDEFTPDHVELLLDACRRRDLEFVYGKALMELADGTWAEVGGWPLQQGQIVHAAVMYSMVLAPVKHNIEAWKLDEPGDWNLWRRMSGVGARMGFVDQIVCRHYREARHLVSGNPAAT